MNYNLYSKRKKVFFFSFFLSAVKQTYFIVKKTNIQYLLPTTSVVIQDGWATIKDNSTGWIKK